MVVGTALGGIDEASRALAAPGALRGADGLGMYDGPTRNLARWLGARGPAVTVTTACASGATSLGLGADLLRSGQADVVLAGGADGLCRFVQRGFNVLRSLTRDAVRPFDRRRSGLLLGEGAGLVVLERVDAASATGPPPARAICWAMRAPPTAPTSRRRIPRGGGSSSPCARPSPRPGSRRTRWTW